MAICRAMRHSAPSRVSPIWACTVEKLAQFEQQAQLAHIVAYAIAPGWAGHRSDPSRMRRDGAERISSWGRRGWWGKPRHGKRFARGRQCARDASPHGADYPGPPHGSRKTRCSRAVRNISSPAEAGGRAPVMDTTALSPVWNTGCLCGSCRCKARTPRTAPSAWFCSKAPKKNGLTRRRSPMRS